MKLITKNKQAYFDYHILDTLEAGIVLAGDEVKSIRAGHVSLAGSYATFRGRELMLINCNISPYAKAFEKRDDQAATRSRKLLLHKRELDRLAGEVARKGVTIVPLSIYLSERNRIKVQLGIAKHKKAVDKKKELKERDIKRETERQLKGRIK